MSLPSVLLYSPQDFRNVCIVARSLEALGWRQIYVYDCNSLIKRRYGKSRSRMMRALSGGAFPRLQWTCIDDPLTFLQGNAGRRVATVVSVEGAVPLSEFHCSSSDLVIFGSESLGIPPEVVGYCDTSVSIDLGG